MTVAKAYLLDVNFLVALAWPNHVNHISARSWFHQHIQESFATCPITESGFARISMNPLVVGEQVSLPAALDLLATYQSKYNFSFWQDDLPLSALSNFRNVSGHRQVTDAYLLALAKTHNGWLVTFDGGIAALGPEGYRDSVVLVR